MEKPFIEIDGKDILIYPQEALAPEGFEFPINKETGISFPFCCKAHTEFYHNTVAWFTKFPNCCEAHREFAKWPVFNKAIYKGAAERLVKQSIYTEYLIQQKVNNDDWFEDITDYIEYNVMCTGQPAVGLNCYFGYVKQSIKRKDIVSDKGKAKKLMSFVQSYYELPDEKPDVEKTDIAALFDIYQKWFDIFPFEFSYFKHLKPGVATFDWSNLFVLLICKQLTLIV